MLYNYVIYSQWAFYRQSVIMSEWFNLANENAFSAAKTAAQKKRLSKYLAYETTRGVRRKFPRRADISPFFGLRWQMDVADLGGKSSFNVPTAERKPRLYALVVIDLFCKYVFIRSLKSKKGPEMAKALESVFSELRPPFPLHPKVIESDAGGEFSNRSVEQLLAKRGIKHKFTAGKHKNEAVERAIRSFKKIAVPYLESNPEAFSKWNRTVKSIARRMNDRKNRSIGTSPLKALKDWPSVQERVLHRMNITPFSEYSQLEEKLLKGGKIKDGGKIFGLGDWVLVVHDKKSFHKETVRNFTYKPWQIISISVNRRPFLYRLRDANGKKAKRRYYAQELRLMERNPLKGKLPIKELLNERQVRGGRKQWLAKYVDHDDDYNKWEPARKHDFRPPPPPARKKKKQKTKKE
jgi:transposase InsO family protein